MKAKTSKTRPVSKPVATDRNPYQNLFSLLAFVIIVACLLTIVAIASPNLFRTGVLLK